jgi:hypothetical protein
MAVKQSARQGRILVRTELRSPHDTVLNGAC